MKRHTHTINPRIGFVTSLLDKELPLPLIVLMGGILFDVYALPGNSDIRIFSLLVFYLIVSWYKKYTSVVSFGYCIMFLSILASTYVMSGAGEATEKLAVWFVVFFVTGIIQAWRE